MTTNSSTMVNARRPVNVSMIAALEKSVVSILVQTLVAGDFCFNRRQEWSQTFQGFRPNAADALELVDRRVWASFVAVFDDPLGEEFADFRERYELWPIGFVDVDFVLDCQRIN